MRNYIEATWNDADQYNYSGEQIGNRGRKSGRVHFNPDGSACVASYGDDEPKATKVPLKNRILPQAARVEKLNADILELENAYRNGEFSPEDYTLLREVAFKKLRRAEELLKKAITPVPKREETEDYPHQASAFSHYNSNDSYKHEHSHSYDRETDLSGGCGIEWLDELSDGNMFKSFLKSACKLCRTAVLWHQKARNYINELKVI